MVLGILLVFVLIMTRIVVLLHSYIKEKEDSPKAKVLWIGKHRKYIDIKDDDK